MGTYGKVAGSIVVPFSATRQSRELPANANIASEVRTKTRVCEFTGCLSGYS